MKNKKLLWQLPFLTLLIVGTVLIIRQQQSVPYQKNSDLIFGTSYHVTYQSDSDLSQGIKAELLKVDQSLSPFNEKSIITAINQNRQVKPDSMFLDVYQLAINKYIYIHTQCNPGFLCSSVGKESACNAGDQGSIPGLGRSPGEGNGNPLQ